MSTRSKGRGCDGKKRHDDKDQAVGQIWSLARHRGAVPSRYQAYSCKHCGGWHVGHRPRGKR
jgi:hypothetical protein